MVREPAVAGRFYGSEPRALAAEVDRYLAIDAERRAAIGIVAPHAGYLYSGSVAGAVYGQVDVPARVIVLGPNHTGLGEPAALYTGEAWRTPLGTVAIDRGLTAALAAGDGVAADALAHRHEHSLEVQVPFLQRARRDVAIAALCLGPLALETCEALGRTVASAARTAGALVVASSDMSHYVPARVAREKDQHAIDRIIAIDPEGLYETVRRERISMCGFVPATVMLFAARELGARSAELVRYSHSGEVTGDDDAVVGYAGIVVR